MSDAEKETLAQNIHIVVENAQALGDYQEHAGELDTDLLLQRTVKGFLSKVLIGAEQALELLDAKES